MCQRPTEELSPHTIVQAVCRVVDAAADLVQHDASFFAKTLYAHATVIKLLRQQSQCIRSVLVEHLEGERDVLVTRIGVVLSTEFSRTAVERHLIQRRGPLEEHVLRHVCDAGVPAIEACSRSDSQRNRRQRTRGVLIDHPQAAVTELDDAGHPGALSTM
jgi:hypothetical protein